jgi:MFS family permease
VSRANLSYAALMLGHMSQGLAFTAFVSALPQMARNFGERGEFIAQMSLALVALGLMIGALVSGWILERAGSRTTMLSALFAYGTLGAGGLVIADPLLLLASRFGVGFACACMVTTCVWGIAATFEGNRRARALGISAALASFSSLASTLIGGYLAQRGGWRLAFIQYPIFAAAGLVLVFIALRQARPARNPTVAAEPFFKPLLPIYLLASLLSAVMFMGSTQFAFLLAADGMSNPARRSLVMAGVTVMATLTSFSYGALQKRWGMTTVFAGALLSMSAALCTAGWSSSIALAVLSAGLMGVYVGVVIPFVHHIVTERSHPSSRSRAISMLTAFNFLGGFLNPIVLAPMGKALGLRGSFLAVAGIMGLLAIGAAKRSFRAVA